jgi:hypothetical protein
MNMPQLAVTSSVCVVTVGMLGRLVDHTHFQAAVLPTTAAIPEADCPDSGLQQ